MNAVLWAGTLVGALFGSLHAIYVYRLIAAETPAGATPGPLRPAYYALWTLGLWLLFGSYVLALWLAGVFFYTLFKAFR